MESTQTLESASSLQFPSGKTGEDEFMRVLVTILGLILTVNAHAKSARALQTVRMKNGTYILNVTASNKMRAVVGASASDILFVNCNEPQNEESRKHGLNLVSGESIFLKDASGKIKKIICE